jgi:hypothetical protein
VTVLVAVLLADQTTHLMKGCCEMPPRVLCDAVRVFCDAPLVLWDAVPVLCDVVSEVPVLCEGIRDVPVLCNAVRDVTWIFSLSKNSLRP